MRALCPGLDRDRLPLTEIPSASLLSPALLVVAALLALLGIGFAVASWRALRRGRLVSCSARALTTLFFATLGALCFALVAATQGYRALTREELACEVLVEPTGRQAFVAHFSFPDGRQEVHTLAGDQLYVDAHILK